MEGNFHSFVMLGMLQQNCGELSARGTHCMKNFLIALSVFIVWSVFGLLLYSLLLSPDDEREMAEKTTQDSNMLNDTLLDVPSNQTIDIQPNDTVDTTAVAAETELTGLKAIDSDGDIVFYFSEGMEIEKNNATVRIPKSVIDYRYKINTYMLQHPDSEVHIASVYSADENLETPNLGIQRGNFIKSELIETGIPAEKIVVKPIIKDISFTSDQTFTKAISFSFKPLDLERIESLKNKIPETKTIYPKFSIDGIMVNDNLRNLMEEVKTITANNPEIMVEVIGHTDNVGNSIDNYKTGLDFARQVRWFLVRKGGISSDRIKASSRGEEDPIDTNSSQRGRNANQRIEVVFYLR